MSNKTDLIALFKQFQTKGQPSSVKAFGSGHINDTFLVTTKSETTPNYIFQRINHNVFKDVSRLMANIVYVTNHLRERLIALGNDRTDLHCLTLVRTHKDQAYYFDDKQNYWAAYWYIPGQTHDLVTNTKQAYSGGEAYGNFISLLTENYPKLLSPYLN